MGSRAVFTTVVALGVVASLAAQSRPDFSGTWTAMPSADAAAGEAPPLLVITQSATELVVTRTTARGKETFTYRLDGVETVETNMLGDTKLVAAWQDDTLVVTRTRTLTAPSGPVADTATESYTMDAGSLVVSSGRKMPNGETRTQRWRYAK
ncbi:MAG: hypothetical protein OEW19_21335 [Acidobacteriota bacterium]|nr:hypothetical protein [Acidobacteriota bacterium]